MSSSGVLSVAFSFFIRMEFRIICSKKEKPLIINSFNSAIKYIFAKQSTHNVWKMREIDYFCAVMYGTKS